MADFIQKFFTGYQKYNNGETRIGELNRLWYDSITNTIRISDGTPGGKIVSGSSMGSTVYEGATPPPNPQAGWLWWDSTSGDLFVYYDNNWVAATAIPNSTYTLPKATVNTLGGVEIGNNILIDGNGKISVDFTGYATTTYVTTAIGNIVFPPTDRITSPNTSHATVIDNTGTTTSGGDILPGAATYNLGSVALPWKDVFVSKGSIVIADQDINVDAVYLSNTAGFITLSRGGLKVRDNTDTFEIFELDNTGKLILKSLQPALTSTSALSLVGNLSGDQLPTTNLGVMLQATGTQDQPSRIYLDGVGTYGLANAYPAFVGRAARGTATSPLPIQSGDLIARFGGNAYGTTIGLNSISNVRVDMVATETQSNTTRGTRVEVWTTPVGSAVPQRSLHIDSQGIDLSEATDINAGVTFKDGSLLTYWPSVSGNANKILRTDGTNFFWSSETVPTGQVLFKGNWDASANTPALSTSLPTGVSTGWQYIVSVAGTQNINGTDSVAYAPGDQVIYNGSTWLRIPAPTAQVQTNWTETNSSLPAYIQNKPTLATVATTGSYTDLSNRPSIPAAQVNSDWNATSGLAQILNKPSIPTQYTDTLARAAITLTSNTPSGTTSTLTYTSGVFTFTSAVAPTQPVNADWTSSSGLSQILNKPTLFSGNYTDLTNKPTLFSGAYSDLTGKPTLFSGAYADLSGKPALFSGVYADLTGKPTIPAAQVNSDWNATTGVAQILNKPTLFSGAYADLSGKPTLFSGSYTDLTNKPSIPAAQIQSDWNQANNASLDYIKNKPTLTNGTVTSVSGTGTVSGLTLTGSVTTTGNLTLGGSISGLTNTNLSGTAGITNANLATPTISGIQLGNNLANLTAGTGITFSTGTTYNGSTAITINNSITQYTDALARAAHSAGTGISYNSSTGVISSTITQYTDALARASISAGTGISYSSSTGVIASTITQYTDALARAAISVSGSLSYNSSTGVISYTTPTYSVTTASASGGGALSLSGTTFTFTPASIPNYGVGGNQLVYVANSAVTLATTTAAQSIFGLTSGVALASNTRYIYEINTVFELTESGPGDPDLKYSLAVSGGAVLAKHAYNVQMNNNGTRTDNSAGITMMSNDITTGFSTAVVVATIKNTYNATFIRGTIDVTTGGNVNFMITLSKAVSALSIPQLSYVTLVPVGAIGANTAAGTWA